MTLSYHLVITFVIEATLLTVHISVATLIGVKLCIRDARFGGGFYAIFFVQCLADYVYFLEGSLLKRINEHALVSKEWFEAPIWGMQWYISCGYTSFFLYFSHIAVALNRLTAIKYPLRHEKLWTGSRLLCVFVVLFLLPVLLNIPKLSFKIGTKDIGDGYILSNLNFEAGETNAFVSISLVIGTCLISSCVEFWTFLLYRRLNNRRKREHVEDYRLLLYALTGLLAQLPMALGYVVFYFYSDSALRPLQNYSYAYLVDAITLSGPVCLLFTSRTTRCEYAKLYFRIPEKVVVVFTGSDVCPRISATSSATNH